MVDERKLEKAYRERLDERIIATIVEQTGMSAEDAMAAFYTSHLAEMMDEGSSGIQYLDYRNLAQTLLTTEPDKFKQATAMNAETDSRVAAAEDVAARKDV